MNTLDNQVTAKDQLLEMAETHLGIVERNNFYGALNGGNDEGAKRILVIGIMAKLGRSNITEEYRNTARAALSVIGVSPQEASALQMGANA